MNKNMKIAAIIAAVLLVDSLIVLIIVNYEFEVNPEVLDVKAPENYSSLPSLATKIYKFKGNPYFITAGTNGNNTEVYIIPIAKGEKVDIRGKKPMVSLNGTARYMTISNSEDSLYICVSLLNNTSVVMELKRSDMYSDLILNDVFWFRGLDVDDFITIGQGIGYFLAVLSNGTYIFETKDMVSFRPIYEIPIPRPFTHVLNSYSFKGEDGNVYFALCYPESEGQKISVIRIDAKTSAISKIREISSGEYSIAEEVSSIDLTYATAVRDKIYLYLNVFTSSHFKRSQLQVFSRDSPASDVLKTNFEDASIDPIAYDKTRHIFVAREIKEKSEKLVFSENGVEFQSFYTPNDFEILSGPFVKNQAAVNGDYLYVVGWTGHEPKIIIFNISPILDGSFLKTKLAITAGIFSVEIILCVACLRINK